MSAHFKKGTIVHKPHPCAKLIKAWADGATIQYRHSTQYPWQDLHTPQWDGAPECYRIKPDVSLPSPEEAWKSRAAEIEPQLRAIISDLVKLYPNNDIDIHQIAKEWITAVWYDTYFKKDK